MTWAKHDDCAPLHPKMLRAGPEACWLWYSGIAFANRSHTDGVIERTFLAALYPGQWSPERLDELAQVLVSVRLWDPLPNGRGWEIHNYRRYQEEATKEAVEVRRSYERERKAAQRARRKQGVRDNVPDMSRGTNTGTTPGHVPGTTQGHDAGTEARHGEGTDSGVFRPSLSQPPDPTRPVPTKERESSYARAPEAEPPAERRDTPDSPRAGTRERPNAVSADAVESALARLGGRRVALNAPLNLKLHLHRAIAELGYPLQAWEALGRQIATNPLDLWRTDYLRGLLQRSGGKVTVRFLLGRELTNAAPEACAYDCAPLTEAFGRLAEIRSQSAQDALQSPRTVEPVPSPPPEPSEATRASIAAIGANLRALQQRAVSNG